MVTSTDSGVTWIPRSTGSSWNTYASIVSSADGNKLVVADNGGYLYTSTDSGASWTPRDSARNWSAVSSSADGVRLLAAERNGQLYTSTDSGVTWVPHESNRSWAGVAMSADGTRMVAVASGDQIYVSADGGQTWTAHGTNRQWLCVASSADGMKLVAGAYQDYIYFSSDGGLTWSPQGPLGDYWISLALSADGNRLVAADFYGDLLATAAATITPLTNPPVIQCPSDIVVTSSVATQVFYTVTASNVCCTNVTVWCNPPSGSFFAPGTTTVNCWASDCAGKLATNTFAVIVVPVATGSAVKFWSPDFR